MVVLVLFKFESDMKELTIDQVNLVSGGDMSTETRVIIGVALAVTPVVGMGMLLGYYANVK